MRCGPNSNEFELLYDEDEEEVRRPRPDMKSKNDSVVVVVVERVVIISDCCGIENNFIFCSFVCMNYNF